MIEGLLAENEKLKIAIYENKRLCSETDEKLQLTKSEEKKLKVDCERLTARLSRLVNFQRNEIRTGW